MIDYALKEVVTLWNNRAKNKHILEYICALFAELAYYHVPQYEVGSQKRAKFIPSIGYQNIIKSADFIDVRSVQRQSELGDGFVASTRNIVAVGTRLGDDLIISFRGTKFLFDWKINFRARGVGPEFPFFSGKLHAGFLEEALRISILINEKIKENFDNTNGNMYATGHSLGGAVGAIAAYFLDWDGEKSVYLYGAPRYGSILWHLRLFAKKIIQIRRPMDIVPEIPPRLFGYCDNLNEYTTNGMPYFNNSGPLNFVAEIWTWIRFMISSFEPHNIETYRRELGVLANAEGKDMPLVPMQKLIKADTAIK